LQKYYDLFPQHFAKRVTHEGVWMPFSDIAKVPGFDDFGFAFQEGAPNVPFDDQHGIASFVYVEPTSHWLAMPRDVPRTYESALSVLNKDLAGARGKDASEMCGRHSHQRDRGGRWPPLLLPGESPLVRWGVFSLNPIRPFPQPPIIPSTRRRSCSKPSPPPSRSTNLQASTRNPLPGPGLDGVYLDSLEMGSGELNYRREHFRTASVPLVFDREGHPCQLGIFNTWTFERDIAVQMRARWQAPLRQCRPLEVRLPRHAARCARTEVNWLNHGEYLPDSDAVMNSAAPCAARSPTAS